jgi:hypothetical protein
VPATDIASLRPGVIDAMALHAFRYGVCAGLAIELHRRTGWALALVRPTWPVEKWTRVNANDAKIVRNGYRYWMHALVLTPSGDAVDIGGRHSIEQACAFWADRHPQYGPYYVERPGWDGFLDEVGWGWADDMDPAELPVIKSFADAVLVGMNGTVAIQGD